MSTWGIENPVGQSAEVKNSSSVINWCAVSKKNIIHINFLRMRTLLMRATETCLATMPFQDSEYCKKITSWNKVLTFSAATTK